MLWILHNQLFTGTTIDLIRTDNCLELIFFFFLLKNISALYCGLDPLTTNSGKSRLQLRWKQEICLCPREVYVSWISPHEWESRPWKIYCFNCLLKDWHGLICLWLNTIIYEEQDDYLAHSAPITNTHTHMPPVFFFLIPFETTTTISISQNIPVL